LGPVRFSGNARHNTQVHDRRLVERLQRLRHHRGQQVFLTLCRDEQEGEAVLVRQVHQHPQGVAVAAAARQVSGARLPSYGKDWPTMVGL
jgi:predicted NAD/FAD-binding protein